MPHLKHQALQRPCAQPDLRHRLYPVAAQDELREAGAAPEPLQRQKSNFAAVAQAKLGNQATRLQLCDSNWPLSEGPRNM